MSIEQNLGAPPDSIRGRAANENEIITYRAISVGAIFSLILGILSILSYTHGFFLGFAVLAVVLGFLADRKIQRFPDMFTGRGLAQTGIVLGLLFGLTSLTIATVQSFLRENQAKAFAKQYSDLLAKGSLEQLVYMGQSPGVRKNTTPEKLIKEMKSSSADPSMFMMQTATIRELKDQLEKPGGEVHFERIENHGVDGLNLYAAALYEVHLPEGAKVNGLDVPPDQRFALAFMKAAKEDGKYQWWVEDLKFPYKPATFVVPQAQIDDGHGHAPGEGH